MSFFFEDDQQKQARVQLELRQKRELLQRKKDKIRIEKRKAKDAAFQKEIDAEVEKMMEYNSADKRKERQEGMKGANLMGSAFFGGGFSVNNNASKLRSAEGQGSLMSLSKNSKDIDSQEKPGQGAIQIPKLSRPF